MRNVCIVVTKFGRNIVITETYKRKMFTHKNGSFVVREGTSDSFVVKEVSGSAYNKLKLYPQDVCLDIGLNIGVFSVIASEKCKFVYSFEPEPENFELASKNVSLNNRENVKLYNVAVIGNNDKKRYLSINKKKNKGCHSLIPKRGRGSQTVDCKEINKIIKETNPSVMKVDTEGAEFEILMAIEPANIKKFREIIFEFHHAHLNDIDTREKYRALISFLKRFFKKVHYREETKGAWVSNVYCTNA